jgi:hypothetical protein
MAKVNRFFFIAFLFSIPFLESCSTVYIDITTLGKNVSMTDSLNRPYTIIKHFHQEQKAYFILIGFVKIGNPDLVSIIHSELSSVQGDAVINLKMEVECDLIDTIVPYAIGALGWGFFGPLGLNFVYAFSMQTYRFSGDVVRYGQ